MSAMISDSVNLLSARSSPPGIVLESWIADNRQVRFSKEIVLPSSQGYVPDDVSLSPTGGLVSVFARRRKGTEEDAAIWLLKRETLEIRGRAVFPQTLSRPLWMSDEALVAYSGSKGRMLVIREDMSQQISLTDLKEGSWSAPQTQGVDQALAVVARHGIQRSYLTNAPKSFNAGSVSNTQGEVVITPSLDAVAVYGVKEGQFSDGSSAVFLFLRNNSWRELSLGVFAQIRSVILVRGWLVVLYSTEGINKYALHDIGLHKWRSLGIGEAVALWVD